MPSQIKYHLDESISKAIASALESRGIDVTTPVEVGLLAASDDQQLAFASSQSRVLVTKDHDFLRIHATGIPHAGIVYWTPPQKNLGELVMFLSLLARVDSAEDMASRVEYF